MKDKYAVGDEIRLKAGEHDYIYAVITNVDNEWITGVMANGRYVTYKLGYAYWRRTDRHFSEIESVLAALGREDGANDISA